MIEQQGQVVAAGEGRLRVRLGARDACRACAAGRGCGAGIFGRLAARRPLFLDVENSIGAACGEAVVVAIPESYFLALIIHFYLLPLLAGLAAAAAGHYLATVLGFGRAGSDLLAMAGGVLGAGLALRRKSPVEKEFSDTSAVHLLRVAECRKFENDE